MYRLFIVITLVLPAVLFARQKGIGFIMEHEGKVFVYRKPGVKTAKKNRVTMVRFEGRKMQHFRVLKYEKLFACDIVQAGKNSRAKIIMKDKNVIFLDEYGRVDMPAEGRKLKGGSLFGLVYGKVRGIVVKSKFETSSVTTPGAVMGIRGTDFLIKYSPYLAKTEVSVLRGEVALKKKEIPVGVKQVVKTPARAKQVVIAAGYMASMKVRAGEKGVKYFKGDLKRKTSVTEEEKSQGKETKKKGAIEPKKISLKVLDEARVLAMIEPTTGKKKMLGREEKRQKVVEEFEKEAKISQEKCDNQIAKDIAGAAGSQVPVKTSEIKKEGRVNLNASLDVILDRRLEEKGLDMVAYKKVPVMARVKAREAGMKDRELTPRNIRERSKTDPSVKSVFDSFVELF